MRPLPKRSIYILPNLLTTANLFCGFNAIIAGINDRFVNAAWLIIVAMVFDLMDGRVARFTRTTSAFGVEYDSFSDLVSFGIAPSLLVYLWSLQPYGGRLGWLAAFLYMACAALRLARFNVMTAKVPKKYFQGLPSPVAAASVATLIIFYNYMEWPVLNPIVGLGLLLFIGSLMISTVLFPSFKDMKVKRESAFGVLAVVILTLVLIAAKPEVMLFVFVYLYIVLGSLVGFFRIFTGKNREIMQEYQNSLEIK